jgi:hypothetical protein
VSPTPDPVLQAALAAGARFVGVEVGCPRYDCDWGETYASAEVVNEYGVKEPIPERCARHDLRVKVERIVEVIGLSPAIQPGQPPPGEEK